jgi:antitoxin VapB
MGKTLNLKDPDAYQLARKLSRIKGESMTRVVVDCLREKLQQLDPQTKVGDRIQQMETAARRIAALPILDTRSEDEILGYDELGLLK